MISVGLVFVAVAGIAFLGFLINALFDRMRIAGILPLMLIGIAIGPILGLINTSPSGIIQQLTPFITAITIAFILFEVGISTNVKNLKKIAIRGTVFTFLTQISTALALSVAAHLLFQWALIYCFIFGFSISGPSAVILPSILKMVKLPSELRTTLSYESVLTETLKLIVPLLLIETILISNVSYSIASFIFFTDIVGAAILGTISALIWLYLLNRFRGWSRNYRWVLSVTMLLATYGISELLGLSTAITIFVFGLMFAVAVAHKDGIINRTIGSPVTLKADLAYIKNYQREIVFFTSTFFFVYIGIRFSLSELSWLAISYAILITAVILIIRAASVPILRSYMSKDPGRRRMEGGIVNFDIGRGLASAVVAIIPISLGINIPGFLDQIFLVILFTNLVSSLGIFLTYRKPKEKDEAAK
ncbi:MAG: cation:proton antiporter [Candidatus Micrarchaeota archaeon]|nr:cation:proton antiporter [Candidatus Micrarchaeota archaeon]